MANWLVECWCENDDSDTLLWSGKYRTLAGAKTACEIDVVKKMGQYHGMDQSWQLEGESYWNSSSNLGYIITRE